MLRPKPGVELTESIADSRETRAVLQVLNIMMRLKILFIVCIAAFSVFATSCGQMATSGVSNGNVVVKKTALLLTTPTNMYKTRLEALKNHDEETLRQTYTVGYLKLYEEVLRKGATAWRWDETQFNKYQKIKTGGWIASEVQFIVDGKRTMLEEYSDI